MCSDGTARLFRWSADAAELVSLHELRSHQYPCMAAHFGVGGALLLTAGLDARACLWDVEVRRCRCSSISWSLNHKYEQPSSVHN